MQKRIQQWPKGPFPEKYRWEAVERRLTESIEAGHLVRAQQALAELGIEPFDEGLDSFVARFLLPQEHTKPDALPTLRTLLEAAQCFGARYLVSALESERMREAGPLLCVIPSLDPVDALLAVGVSGPAQGIGGSTLVRFLRALRSFAKFDLEALGETAWRMSIACKDDESEVRVAMRVLEILPSALREGVTPERVRESLQAGRLDLDWGQAPSIR